MVPSVNDDMLELRILERYTAHHKEAELSGSKSKCAKELDMRDVLAAFVADRDAALDYEANRWLAKLAPDVSGQHHGPLKRCTDHSSKSGPHRYHARAFID